MVKEAYLEIPSFSRNVARYKSCPAASDLVKQGDALVYSTLNPFSEEAFNYRDSIEVDNHASGISVAERILDPHGLVLYMASSYGMGPLLLKELGYKTTSVDIDCNAVKFAKRHLPSQINANAENLPFNNEVFQTIVSRDFLAQDYHLLDNLAQENILYEMNRVLKRKGQALFYTLYSPEHIEDLGKNIQDGLPNISLLDSIFSEVTRVQVSYLDSPKKNSLVYIGSKE
jgi:ubiquinone/menaquinone biosynthesis C-methylase UbiE